MPINEPQPQVVMALEERREWLKARKREFRLKPPIILYPSHLEREYRNQVGSIYKDLELIIEQALPTSRLERLLNSGQLEQGTRLDDFDDELRAILSGISVRFAQVWSVRRIQNLSTAIASKVQAFNKSQNDKVFRKLLNVDVFRSEPNIRNVMKSFASRNASLITRMSDDTIKNIEQVIMAGVRNGLSNKAVSEQLQKKLKIAKNRADLIARDQINKLNGQLNLIRQTEMGVKRYRWRTALDERVRTSHALREGRIFRWQDPPSDGHPGEAINCRCVPEPILEDLLE